MATLRPELLDELLADYERPEDLLGDGGLFRIAGGNAFRGLLPARAGSGRLSDLLCK